MEETYDAIVLGTGLTECVISGLLSVSGMKVLHLDRNKYYGGESASLSIEQLFERFEPKSDKPEAKIFGRNKDYQVDLIPKFLMANGKLVKMLHSTGVTKYMDFTQIEGSYVYKDKKIFKVPSTPSEVVSTKLLGFFDKFRARSFLTYVHQYDPKNPKTHKHGYDLNKMSMQELYSKYKISKVAIEFLGHTVALWTDESYLQKPAIDTVLKLQLYANSLALYGKSPYIYPLYGLGELPQVFARLSAVYGGTYMLPKKVEKIHFDEDGKVCGVQAEGKIAKCKIVVADPSYFPNKVKKVGKVIRVICIMEHPIPNTEGSSCQIIIPQSQLKRKTDIYVCCTSYNHRTVPKGKFAAIIAASVETENPEKEIQPALDLVGSYIKKFVYYLDTFEPTTSGKSDNVFISKSYDYTTHFESCTADVEDIFERITGKKYDYNKKPPGQEQQ